MTGFYYLGYHITNLELVISSTACVVECLGRNSYWCW